MEKDIIITPEIEEQITTIEKEQGVFPQGTINITSNGEVDVAAYEMANVDVDFALQDKEVSYTSNTQDIIQPDEGYQGLSRVQVSVNVPPTKYSPKFISFYNYSGSDLLNETRDLDTSNITSMASMFYMCQNVISLDVSGFDTSKVTDMSSMFYYCFKSSGGITNLNLSNFTSEHLTNTSFMFYNSTYLKTLNLSNITTGITNAQYMFASCERLEELDLSKMDFSTITNHGSMFYNVGNRAATKPTKVYVKDAEAQQWVLNLTGYDRPNTWTTANVIIKS